MASKVRFSIRDYSDEYGSTSFSIDEVTAANFDAQVAAIQGLNTAMAALTLGNITGVQFSVDPGVAGADERPSSPFAQRELRALFGYQDNVTGQRGTFSIPCADMAIVGQGGTDEIDLTLSLVAPLVTAFEALARSTAGNPITINYGRVVGRSS